MRVRFDDVDHAGIVYYPRFFHYFHVAFEEMFIERLGAGSSAAYQRVLDERRIGFPAVHAEADFKAPLRFGDLFEVELTAPHVGQKSIGFVYGARKVDDARTLAAEGRVTTAVISMDTFRAVALPDDLRPLFEGLR
jgi:4-hydroxybenzoyl-CoA thioesterase